MWKDLQNVWNLTKFHTGAAEKIIGHQEMPDNALGETQIIANVRALFIHTKIHFWRRSANFTVSYDEGARPKRPRDMAKLRHIGF